MTPMWWQHTVERGHRLTRQPGTLTTIRDQGIGREDSGPAAICDNREPRSTRAGLLAEQLRHVEQFGDGVHAQNSSPTESGIAHFIASREGAGVRGGRFR